MGRHVFLCQSQLLSTTVLNDIYICYTRIMVSRDQRDPLVQCYKK